MFEDRPITLGDWLDLREEARAAEELLTEMQFAPAETPAYWAMSADLLAIVQSIEERLERWRVEGAAPDNDASFAGLRKRLRLVQARSEEIRVEPAEE